MDTTTKIYHNTSDQEINVIGIGIIPAGEITSITSAYPPPVVLENYPGLEDISNQPWTSPDDTASSNSLPSSPASNSSDTQIGDTNNG